LTEGRRELVLKRWRVGLNYSEVLDSFDAESLLLLPRTASKASKTSKASKARTHRRGGGGAAAAEEEEMEEEAAVAEDDVGVVYVSERWEPSHTDAVFAMRWRNPAGTLAYVSIRQRTSACVSIRHLS
jgi:hypothetical protein